MPAAVAALVLMGALLAVGQGFVAGPRAGGGIAWLAHLTGMAAGYGIAMTLILMARLPLLERRLGADRLARWHSVLGPATIGLVVVHTIAATGAWATAAGVDLGRAAVDLLDWPGLPTATVGTVFLLVVGVVSIRAVRRRLSYEHWHWLHLLTYLAAALGFVHQLAGPDLIGRPVVQVLWSLLYAYAFAVVLRYRLLQPVFQFWRHRLRVLQIRRESDAVVSVVMSGRHLDELRVEPGQFFRWRFLAPSTWRSSLPFSLSAVPRLDRLRITFRLLGDGTRAIAELEPGVKVFAEGPYGRLTSRLRTRSRVLLIAGGVGITPMRGLFEALDVPGTNVTLVYRASTEQDLVLRDELDEIAQRSGARIVYLVGPTSDPANAVTKESLERLVGNLADHDVFVCASPRLAGAVRRSLLAGGFPRRQFHEERFSM